MTTEAKLEQVLAEGLASEKEEEEVSPEEVKEPEEKIAEPEEAEEEALTPAIQAKIQEEADKRTNSYREKREADTALIRSLSTQLKEQKAERHLKEGNKRLEAILAGDEEEGISPAETKTKEKALKEFNELYQDYKKNAAEVEESAQFIGNMTEKLSKNIVKEFGLDDPNPNIRAVNGVKLLDETVAVMKHNQDFLMAMESFLPKGDELREKLEEIVEGLAEFTDEKSKKLYLKDRLQGIKPVRKKPPAPSDVSGGVDLTKLSSSELIERGLRKLNQKIGGK